MSVAVVVGAGPGLGAALCRRFAAGGLRVAAARRRSAEAEALAAEIGGRAYACNVAEAAEVDALFAGVEADLGTPELVVFNASTHGPEGILDIDPVAFAERWHISCLGGLHVAQAALRAMLPQGRGSLIFTGATASLRGGRNFANLAVPKFGLRALAQSTAREFGPQGIHVAHTIIDGQIRHDARGGRHSLAERGPDALLEPGAIAETYWQLHQQPRNAWTHEIDLRPCLETF